MIREDEDDLFLRWCLCSEPLSDFKDIKNENRIVEIVRFEGEYKEYLQKLIDDYLN